MDEVHRDPGIQKCAQHGLFVQYFPHRSQLCPFRTTSASSEGNNSKALAAFLETAPLKGSTTSASTLGSNLLAHDAWMDTDHLQTVAKSLVYKSSFHAPAHGVSMRIYVDYQKIVTLECTLNICHATVYYIPILYSIPMYAFYFVL